MTMGKLFLLLAPGFLGAVGQGVEPVPAGTFLAMATNANVRMRVGEPVQAELLYGVYADNKLVLPAHSLVSGRVVDLATDGHRRTQARLRVDFTPFYKPAVRFDAIHLPDGATVALAATDGVAGAPVYRLVPTPMPKGGLVGQYYEIAKQYVRDGWAVVAGPDKGDRAKQFVYGQLPYHPQRIAKGTAWTVQTLQPLALPVAVNEEKPAVAAAGAPWRLQAYLQEAISSESSTVNEAIRAVVAEPILNGDGTIAVPQGAVISGTVTRARPARYFDRAGVLRFSFTQLTLPEQPAQTVRTTLAGADSGSARQLEMGSEGEVAPKAQDKILLPALLVALAGRPLDQDRGQGALHQFGKDAVASNGLGLIGFIVGTAARQPYLAAGFGYYSAALAIYPTYIGKGAPVAFPKGTRIVLEATPSQTPVLGAK